MDLPASHYGKLDKRNPVFSAFEQEINSFTTLMRRVASSSSQDNNSYAKGWDIERQRSASSLKLTLAGYINAVFHFTKLNFKVYETVT